MPAYTESGLGGRIQSAGHQLVDDAGQPPLPAGVSLATATTANSLLSPSYCPADCIDQEAGFTLFAFHEGGVGWLVDAGHPAQRAGAVLVVTDDADEAGAGGGSRKVGPGAHGGEDGRGAGDEQAVEVDGSLDHGRAEEAHFQLHFGGVQVAGARGDGAGSEEEPDVAGQVPRALGLRHACELEAVEPLGETAEGGAVSGCLGGAGSDGKACGFARTCAVGEANLEGVIPIERLNSEIQEMAQPDGFSYGARSTRAHRWRGGRDPDHGEGLCGSFPAPWRPPVFPSHSEASYTGL